MEELMKLSSSPVINVMRLATERARYRFLRVRKLFFTELSSFFEASFIHYEGVTVLYEQTRGKEMRG